MFSSAQNAFANRRFGPHQHSMASMVTVRTLDGHPHSHAPNDRGRWGEDVDVPEQAGAASEAAA